MREPFNQTKNLGIYVGLSLLISTVILATSCGSEDARQKIEENKRQEQRSKQLNDLVAKYRATADWQAKFDHNPPYSAEVENALIASNGTPIAFFGYLKDLERADGKYFARVNYSGAPRIHFILECKPELAAKLLTDPERFEDVAVVAIISSVNRPAIKLESATSGNGDDGAEIDVTTSRIFTAHGSCIDMVFLK